MANWWDAAPIVQAPQSERNWWDDAPIVSPDTAPPNLPPPGARQEPYSGTLLPFTKDEEGNVRFDSNAGLFGVVKRAVGLPGEVYRGEIDPLSDEGIGRAVEFAATATPVNPALRVGERVIPGVVRNMEREAVPTPTVDELKAASRAGYNAVRDSGVEFTSPSVTRMAGQTRVALENDGFLPNLAPKTFDILGRLETAPDASIMSIAGLDAARKSLKNARLDFANAPERAAARQVIEAIDGFIQNPPAASVLAGSPAEASATLRAARGNHAAAKRSETLTGVRDSAELRAAAANSGQNLDNATRQRLASLVLSPKASAGFSASEREAIEAIARGSAGTNAARYLGNLLGGGGGLGMAITGVAGSATGAAAGGVPGAALGALLGPAVGAIAKNVAARGTRKGLLDLDVSTRGRSPLLQDRIAAAPIRGEIDPATDLLARLLGLSAPQAANR